ncbi:MAG: serine hydroxymethyltransferase [Anaerolineae bacterium]|jgi:glycine hydroxymethyltransferase
MPISDPLCEVRAADPELSALIDRDMARQRNTLVMIASENYVSPAVMQAMGSALTNKYAEGTPRHRWYNGCRIVDEVEQLAIDRARALFGAEHANVQPHAGSQANAAAYMALLELGDLVLAMDLNHGGHLTHGSPLSFSGQDYRFAHYGVAADTCTIDYDALEEQALSLRPRAIVAGASSYPRLIDFARLRAICDRVAAYLVVDMAHIAGLVAGGAHPSPVPYADVVTSTTHKTLRGPRGGLILCKREYARKVDRAVFPGIQGGPLLHTIGAKAVCFLEAAQPAFCAYSQQVVANAQALAAGLLRQGLRLVSGGTDNHLLLVDVSAQGLNGRDVADRLEQAGICCNKNVIPFDANSPATPSGIRLGTPAVTTRGLGEHEMGDLARMIAQVIRNMDDEATVARVRQQTLALCEAFPLAF